MPTVKQITNEEVQEKFPRAWQAIQEVMPEEEDKEFFWDEEFYMFNDELYSVGGDNMLPPYYSVWREETWQVPEGGEIMCPWPQVSNEKHFTFRDEVVKCFPEAIEALEADEDWRENLKDPEMICFFTTADRQLFIRVDEIASYVWNRWNPITKAWEDCDDV